MHPGNVFAQIPQLQALNMYITNISICQIGLSTISNGSSIQYLQIEIEIA